MSLSEYLRYFKYYWQEKEETCYLPPEKKFSLTWQEIFLLQKNVGKWDDTHSLQFYQKRFVQEWIWSNSKFSKCDKILKDFTSKCMNIFCTNCMYKKLVNSESVFWNSSRTDKAKGWKSFHLQTFLMTLDDGLCWGDKITLVWWRWQRQLEGIHKQRGQQESQEMIKKWSQLIKESKRRSQKASKSVRNC